MSEGSKTSYNLSIPTETYRSLQKIATQEGITMAELLRKAIKWFMFVRTIKLDSDARLLVDQKGDVKEIVIDLM